MHLQNVGAVIAIRKFARVSGGEAIFTIGKPQPFPAGRDYYCPCQISGIGSGKARYATGIDGIQALLLALMMADADLAPRKNTRPVLSVGEGRTL